MEFVKVVMHHPFGWDSYIECYIQITNNEKVIEFLYSTLMDDGIEFTEVYSEKDVDSILRCHAGTYIGHADVERYVALMGKINIDIETPVSDANDWWENLVESAKDPEFVNIAEKVIDSDMYKINRPKYDPNNYPEKVLIEPIKQEICEHSEQEVDVTITI